MTTGAAPRPAAEEYDPYYANYIARVPEGDLSAILERQLGDTLDLVRSIPEERGGHRYAPGKWSIKEALGHVIDSERVFAYRVLRFARADPTPLPGYEQGDYVPAGRFDARTLADLAEELAAVRRGTIHLLRHLDEAALSRRGNANGETISVRALAYIIAGHERHHVEILRTRYL